MTDRKWQLLITVTGKFIVALPLEIQMMERLHFILA